MTSYVSYDAISFGPDAEVNCWNPQVPQELKMMRLASSWKTQLPLGGGLPI